MATIKEPSMSTTDADILRARSLLESLNPSDLQSRFNLEQRIRDLEARRELAQQEEARRKYEEDMKFLDETDLGNPYTESLDLPQRPHTSHINAPAGHSFGDYAGSNQNHFGGHFASDSLIGMNAPPTWGLPPSSYRMDRPNLIRPQLQTDFRISDLDSSSDAMSALSSGRSPSLPFADESCKRQRESLTHPLARDAKSRRATESPAPTGPETPSSMSSLEMPDNSDLIRLLGSNPKDDMRDMAQEQRDQAEMLKARKEQERKDEAFARRLWEEDQAQLRAQSSSIPSSIHTWRGGSNAALGPFQTMLDSQDKRRQDSLHLPNPYHSSSTSTPNHSNGSRSVFSDQPILKHEQPPTMTPQMHTSQIIDLDNDDDDAGEPSSDLVEIDPSSFRDSGRKLSRWASNTTASASQQRPGSSGFIKDEGWTDIGQLPSSGIYPNNQVSSRNTFLTSYDPSSALSPNSYMFNKPYDVRNQSNGSIYGQPTELKPGATTWQSVVDGVKGATRGVYNAAYSLLDEQLPKYPTGAQGFEGSRHSPSGYVYGAAGSSTNPHILGNTSGFDPLVSLDEQHNILNNALSQHGMRPDDPLFEKYLERVDYLTNDPTRTTAEIKCLLENIRPDEDLPPENREGTPDGMRWGLMEHQKLGLAWMKNMEEGSNKGGILADDMGLGKTIQALALMLSRKSPDPARKTTLIVAPVALMKQWEREIDDKLVPGHKLTTYVLHGSGRDVDWNFLRRHDVVLTTFGTLATELKRKEGIEMQKRANPNWRPTGKADRLPLLGDECLWYRVIIDEAQCIKNKNTKAAQGACYLQALTRFCMSGTPMMNNVTELYSLIHFLRIKPYNEQEKFSRDFTRPLKGMSQHAKDQAMQKLQALLKAILLRRTKKSLIDGQPILQLPERTTEAQHAVFDQDEQDFYKALESKTQLQFNKYLKANTIGKSYANILVLLLRLRQACCHPHLIKDFGVSTGADLSAADMSRLAKDLAPEVVARIKEQGLQECPVCMESEVNPTIFYPCGHSTCSECFARLCDPSNLIADGQDADGRNAANIRCPNCRGKVEPSKVIDFNTFKKIHAPDQFDLDALDAEGPSETEDSDDDTDDDANDSEGSLKDFIIEDSEDWNNEGYRKGDTPFEKSKAKEEKLKKGKGKSKEKRDKGPMKNLAQLKKEGARNQKARNRYLKRLRKDYMPSAKITKVMEILETTHDRNEGEKTIIFSQFTSLLDLLEVPINDKGWGYRRYDGSMSANARNEAVIEFGAKKDCNIMLISLKAGNAGLNLTKASQVVIFDPFWNPYIEEQAIDRAHRIGQTRPVQVHRILVPETVEDRILALQEKKREMIEGALDEKASQNIGRLGVRELAFLFVGAPVSFSNLILNCPRVSLCDRTHIRPRSPIPAIFALSPLNLSDPYTNLPSSQHYHISIKKFPP